MQFFLNIDIIKTEYGFRYLNNQKDMSLDTLSQSFVEN